MRIQNADDDIMYQENAPILRAQQATSIERRDPSNSCAPGGPGKGKKGRTRKQVAKSPTEPKQNKPKTKERINPESVTNDQQVLQQIPELLTQVCNLARENWRYVSIRTAIYDAEKIRSI